MMDIAKSLSPAGEVHHKLDPRLAALVELDDSVFAPADPVPAAAPTAKGRFEAAPLLERRSGPLAFLSGPPLSTTLEASASHVPVFVTTTGPEVLDEVALRAGGLTWRSRAGAMATAVVNMGQIQALEEDERVLAVEWTGGAKPHGAADTPRGVSPRRTLGLDLEAPASLDGFGVVIGIVDVEGIDIYHPDFATADGAPRLLAIWDQTKRQPQGLRGKTPVRYGYGVAYTREDVWVELDPNQRVRYAHVDHVPLKASHGTMVAGVAAGGGSEDPEARGVAPGADLVFVSTPASGAGALAAMTEIAEAVDFVLREAGDRPCVVNVSLGDDLGPRDGTSPVERFFDAVLAERPGRAIVVAAGNSREAGTHATGELAGPGSESVLLCEANRASGRNAVVEIWYDRMEQAAEGISVQVGSPDGSVATPIIAPDGRAGAFDLGSTRIIVASVPRYPESDNALIRIEMFPREPQGTMDTGTYRIQLRGGTSPRTYYAFLDHPSFKLHGEAEGGAAAVTITSPGTCRSAITVGACSDTSDAPAEFTGSGPARRAIDKPDALACGVSLRAPSAATLNRSYPSFTGTSGAAPLVTGAVALAFAYALRRGVRLTAAETRSFVRAASLPPAGAAPPARTLGPGRLRLPASGRLDGLFAAADVPLPPPPRGG